MSNLGVIGTWTGEQFELEIPEDSEMFTKIQEGGLVDIKFTGKKGNRQFNLLNHTYEVPTEPEVIIELTSDNATVTGTASTDIVLVVDASHIVDVSELVLTNNLNTDVPEFTVMAESGDYGFWSSSVTQAATLASGVEANFAVGSWTLTFTVDGLAHDAIVANEGIEFYLVAKDIEGRETGTVEEPHLTVTYTI